jgi:hypothetical protein
LTISIDGVESGDIEIGLFGDVNWIFLFKDVPKTAENFRALCTGENGVG